MQDLFSGIEPEDTSHMPLAARMRPRSFEEFVGQEHIIGPGRVLRRAIESDRLGSMIFWGPPGSGKTALARLIARISRARFSPVSAVGSGVADLRRVVSEAEKLRRATGQRTILFIDEIHRFNKAQQDAILPHVEDGTVILIGATTENPSFEVNSALLSRSRVFTLHPLAPEHIETVVRRAMTDEERGLGRLQPALEGAALKHLVDSSNGDARIALNALELAVAATGPDAEGRRLVTLAAVEDALQHRALNYDRAGDQHYDTISAFIKSVRGSDPDAAVYWLARMLEAGEDVLFIARRIVILAAEDIGLADPQALVVAIAAQQAVHFIGMPEGFYPLAEATLYLATAPKSNSVGAAYSAALADVRSTLNQPVPLHLRNAPTGLMRSLGYGRDYKYAHDFEGHFVPQQYLPDSLKGKQYYRPGALGFEQEIMRRMQSLRRPPGLKQRLDRP